MGDLLMLKGLPASGKTTYARDAVSRSMGEVKRVNKDDLRKMLDNGTWRKESEELVIEIRDQICRTLLRAGKTVIVDDTNLHEKHEEQLRQIAEDEGVAFGTDERFLTVSVEECVRRDVQRRDSVGEDVIRDMAEMAGIEHASGS